MLGWARRTPVARSSLSWHWSLLYDAFTRMLGQTARTNYDAGFRELAAKGFRSRDFPQAATGPWIGGYARQRSEYFARLDGVVQSAARHGIGLIPSFFWNMSTVPDLVGEPCNRWGNPNSRTSHSCVNTRASW